MNKSFEDQWKDALGEASLTPPPEIWDRVEAELNRKKSRFLLFREPTRKKTALLSGVAAAVALVLGTLFFMHYAAPEAQVSHGQAHPAASVQDSPAEATAPVVPAQPAETPAPPVRLATRVPQATTIQPAVQPGEEDVYPEIPVKEAVFSVEPIKENTVSAHHLASLPFREMQAYAPYPRVEAPEEAVSETRIIKKEKRGWMGVIASNAPFNPHFSAPGFQQQALSAVQNSNAFLALGKGPSVADRYSYSSRTDARSSFKPGQSMSFGLIFGRKLKKRLALESGLKFTRATTTHTSNVYAVNTQTGESESFSFANYVSGNKNMSEVLISVNGTSHYSYHFLSVPLLLNYEVLKIGKLNMNAVGGISSEVLLSGTVVNAKNNEQSFNAGNSNFKPVNIAGVGGLRLSYPVTSVLDINLGGTYQHFLTSGLQKSTDATFRPSMLGVNLGLSVRQ